MYYATKERIQTYFLLLADYDLTDFQAIFVEIEMLEQMVKIRYEGLLSDLMGKWEEEHSD